MGVAFTEEGLGRGGWPDSSVKPLTQHSLLQPTPGTPCHLPTCWSLSFAHTPLHAWSHILLFLERAVGDGGICFLSPDFVWAPDSQEPWPLPPPAGTPLPLAQYRAQSRPSAETPGVGLMSPEPSEICHIQAEKSSSINGGERRGSLREAGGPGYTQTSGVPGLHLPVPHTMLWTGEPFRSPISSAVPLELPGRVRAS